MPRTSSTRPGLLVRACKRDGHWPRLFVTPEIVLRWHRDSVRRRWTESLRADLLAVTVQRAFETGRAPPAATRALLAERFTDLLRDLINADQAGSDGA